MEKVTLTNSERQRRFKQNNPKSVELDQLRTISRRQEVNKDPEKAAAVKEANRKRQAAKRARDKAAKENTENIPPSDSDEATSQKCRRSSDLFDVTLASDDGETNQNHISNISDDNDSSFRTPKSRQRISSGDLSSDSSKSRQLVIGLKLRKKNDKKKNLKIDELIEENNDLKAMQDKHDGMLAEQDFKVKDLEVEVEKLKNRVKELEHKENNHDNWFIHVYKNLSEDGKKEIKVAFAVARPNLEKGTISRLRHILGINFSKALPENNEEMTEIKLKIVEFAKINTIDVPDKRKYAKGIRFRTASLLVLYNTFEAENPNICSYQTFCQYWPAHFVKPCASEFGTCLCIYCQNIELKVNALQIRNLVSNTTCLESILVDLRKGDFTLENDFKAQIESLADDDRKDIDIAFNQWEKVKQTEISKNTGRVKGDKMMRLARHLNAKDLGKQVLKEYDVYKEHLERDFVIKAELKKVRMEAMEDDDLAVIHIDWAEQHKLTEVKEIQSAFFNGRYAYDIHTGYCYTKEDCHGFASISDSSDHKAEAIHCAIKQKIVELVGNGKKRIVICSDSPTSQYRNAKNIYLMKKIAMELKITIRLIFTEAGHGKSPCDGVGGNIKTQVEAAMLNNFGKHAIEAIHSVEDVKKVIKDKTNLSYHITIHTKEEIDRVKEKMPKLGPLVGALKLHEVLVSADGLLQKKDLPSDTFYKPVTIRETRIRILETEQLEPEITESEDVLNTAFTEIEDVEQVENVEVEHVENEVNDQSIISRRPRITRYRTVAQIASQLEDDDNDISDDNDYDDDE